MGIRLIANISNEIFLKKTDILVRRIILVISKKSSSVIGHLLRQQFLFYHSGRQNIEENKRGSPRSSYVDNIKLATRCTIYEKWVSPE